MPEYAELEIGFHRRETAAYTIEWRFAQPGSATEVGAGPRVTIAASFDFAVLRTEALNPVRYGQTLTRMVFAQEALRTAFAQARAVAQSSRVPLRIQILVGSSAPELHALHWELLRDPLDDAPLAMDENIPLSRYLEGGGWRKVRLRPHGKLRAMVVIANPSNLSGYKLPHIDVEAELQRARAGLGTIPIIQTLGFIEDAQSERATLKQLLRGLRDEKPDILYLAAHGTFKDEEPWLWLEDEGGRAERVSGHNLATQFRELSELPTLVVLVSCQSAGEEGQDALAALGPRLADAGVPAVLAMQGNLTFETASQFTPRFFAELQKDGQVDRALAVARGEVRARPDFWRPALFTRLRGGLIWAETGELPAALGESPFKGLEFFDQDDAAMFFGREALTAQLVGQLREHRFLAVVGASGSGKSSVVRAGLVPALQQAETLADGTLPPPNSARWPAHVITPTAHPLESLAASLTRDSESVSATDTLMDELRRDPRSLHLYARKLLAHTSADRLLLVVDQFEELFTACKDEAERTAFVDNLITAAAPGTAGPTLVVITLRADFYVHCGQFDNLRAALETGQKYIGAMNEDELRRAIEEPARRGGWELEPGLVEVLLTDVGISRKDERAGEPGALPLLSHALLETWRRRRGRRLTLGGYAESGGVRGAIAKTADTVYAQLTTIQQAIARTIFLRLTELGEGTQDTRRRAAHSELIPPADASAVEDVLMKLADARLVTTGHDVTEVAHEALIREWPTLRTWLNEDRESLRLHRQVTNAAREWEVSKRDEGLLYRGARLTRANEWASVPAHEAALNIVERDFLSASRELTEREARKAEAQRQRELQLAREIAATERSRFRLVSIAGLVAVVAFVVAIVFGLDAQNSALRAQTSAHEAQTANTQSAQNLSTADAANIQAASNLATAEAEARLRATQEAVAKTEADRANLQADLARARQLAAQSLLQKNDNLGVALLLGVEAYRLQSDFSTAYDARDALLRGLQSSPRLRYSLTGYVDWVRSVAFSPKEGILASSSCGKRDSNRNCTQGEVRLWDVSDPGAPEPLGEPLTGFVAQVTSVAFSPDGNTLAAGGCAERNVDGYCTTGQVLLWDVSNPRTPQPLGEPLSGYSGWVWSVAFSPDGNTLASGSCTETDSYGPCSQGEVQLWDVSDSRTAQRLGEPLSDNMTDGGSVAFSPDGHTLAASSYQEIHLWDVSDPSTPQPLGEPLTGFTVQVQSLAFSPDKKTLAAGGCAGQGIFNNCLVGEVRLWDVSDPHTPQPLGEPLTDNLADVGSVAFSNDGNILAAGSCANRSTYGICARGEVRLWDVANPGAPLPLGEPLTGPTAEVLSLAFSPDGNILASGSCVESDSFAFCGQGEMGLWDISNPRAPLPFGEPLTGPTAEVLSLAFSPNENILAFGSCPERGLYGSCQKGEVQLWDVSDPGAPQPLGTSLTGYTADMWSLAFSRDGNVLASGGCVEDDPFGKCQKGEVRLWDVSNPQQPQFLGEPVTGFAAQVWSVAFSADGHTLATSSYQDVRLWDISDPHLPQPLGGPLTGYSGWVLSVAFSPDGNVLASGGCVEDVFLYNSCQASELQLWDVSDPSKPQPLGDPLTGFAAQVWSVAFSPHGDTLAVGGCARRGFYGSCEQGEVRLWDVSDPHTPQPLGQPLTGSTADVLSVAFSPDGNTLASGSCTEGDSFVFCATGKVQLWDISHPRAPLPLGEPLIGSLAEVLGVAFSPDGKTLASVSRNKQIILWPLDPTLWTQLACERAGRNFTQSEWTRFLPGEVYRKTCDAFEDEK